MIYEAHVRGLTKLHPALPESERGTYRGLSHRAVIEHLLGLGVTAIELLPAHQFVSDSWLSDRALSNYWGYNTIGFEDENPVKPGDAINVINHSSQLLRRAE